MTTDEIIDSVSDNLINGNLTIMKNQIKKLPPLIAGYVCHMVMQNNHIPETSKNWFIRTLEQNGE